MDYTAYKHAQCLDPNGRLADIVDVYEYQGMIVAKLRRFNGEPVGVYLLNSLKILDRTWD